MTRHIVLYAVRSLEDPRKYRSYGESFTNGVPFADAQLWRNPKTAAKEARYQEERREWSKSHGGSSYMGPCEVVPVRIGEPE